jgi:uncharacterized membrane protein YeaQ/YmgE (transglycosylase-associated protein family)
METGEIIALLIVGALAGTAAATLLGERRNRTTTDLIRNTVIGVLGALIGGFLFNALDITMPDVLKADITLANILVAFVGALILLVVARLVNR